MVAKLNLFDAATGRGRIMRQGDIVCLVMDGGGAVIIPSLEFNQAQKWAASRPGTGNLLTDRARFLDQFTGLVSRPGSQQVTRGSDHQLERIVRCMRQSGYTIGEWIIPPQMKEPGYWAPAGPATKAPPCADGAP